MLTPGPDLSCLISLAVRLTCFGEDSLSIVAKKRGDTHFASPLSSCGGSGQFSRMLYLFTLQVSIRVSTTQTLAFLQWIIRVYTLHKLFCTVQVCDLVNQAQPVIHHGLGGVAPGVI